MQHDGRVYSGVICDCYDDPDRNKKYVQMEFKTVMHFPALTKYWPEHTVGIDVYDRYWMMEEEWRAR